MQKDYRGFIIALIIAMFFFISLRYVFSEIPEDQILEVVNQYRTERGIAPVQKSWALTYVADKYAFEMGRTKQLTHFLWNNETTWEQIRQYLYLEPFLSNIKMLYQEISVSPYNGKFDPYDVVNTFMDSDLHRKGLMSIEMKYIGIGYTVGEDSNSTQSLWVCIYIGAVYK